MLRRQFVWMLMAAIMPALRNPSQASVAGRRFVFRIKTKNESIIGNIVILASDIENAKYKLRKPYPDCTILEGREK